MHVGGDHCPGVFNDTVRTPCLARPKNCCYSKSCGFTKNPGMRPLDNKCPHPQEVCFLKIHLKWLPETSDSTEPYTYFFSCICILVIKFNYKSGRARER